MNARNLTSNPAANAIATLDDVVKATPDELAKANAVDFARALRELATLEAFTKHAKAFVEQASDLRYRAMATSVRTAQKRDFGLVRLTDDREQIVCDVRKIVDWDQAKLGTLAKKIEASGEAVSQYIEVTYKVAESKYNAWP